MKNLIRTCMLALLLISAACDSKQGEVDLERERYQLMLSFLLLPRTWDYQASCRRAVSSALACADSAEEEFGAAFFGATAGFREVYLTSIRTFFEVEFADDASSEAICVEYAEANTFKDTTPPARVCQFDCEQSYWDNGPSASGCTASGFGDYLGGAAADTVQCLADCLARRTEFVF